MHRFAAAATIAALILVSPSPADGRGWLIPPVDGPVSERFRAPGTDFGSGHRGIDYEVPEDTPVRAAAGGFVGFAGRVGGRNAVVVAHGGVETTYTWLSEVRVKAYDHVDTGHVVGLSGEAHPGEPGLHFGVKLAGDYLDPVDWLGPLSVAGAVRLAPVVRFAGSKALSDGAQRASPEETGCLEKVPHPGTTPPPPNDNVAVLIAGLQSSSADRPRFEYLARRLGYPPGRTYVFSYRGSDDPDLHERYEAAETHDGIQRPQRLLDRMLRRVKARHPRRGVDLLAHSTGGLVARLYLVATADGWDPARPPVENVVTLATPHQGAPLAWAAHELRDGGSIGGPAIIEGLGEASERAPWLIDPRSAAFHQAAPGSDLLSMLAAEDVALGARVLSLGRALDPLLPGEHSLYGGKPGALVPGVGHAGILESQPALALSYAFVRGAPPPCAVGTDGVAAGLGRLLADLERSGADGYEALEEYGLQRLARRVPGPWDKASPDRGEEALQGR